MCENERFGLVFAKIGYINSGTDVQQIPVCQEDAVIEPWTDATFAVAVRRTNHPV